VTRVAVVDLGTNSTRLLVADVEDGAVRELDRRLEITRLGEGVDSRRQLLPQAIARLRNVLGDYRRAVEGLGG
jgi:exopolyphosphatase / guanosine-5'-triphosphate,3'-diphosphate pyrophosphatase